MKLTPLFSALCIGIAAGDIMTTEQSHAVFIVLAPIAVLFLVKEYLYG